MVCVFTLRHSTRSYTWQSQNSSLPVSFHQPSQSFLTSTHCPPLPQPQCRPPLCWCWRKRLRAWWTCRWAPRLAQILGLRSEQLGGAWQRFGHEHTTRDWPTRSDDDGNCRPCRQTRGDETAVPRYETMRLTANETCRDDPLGLRASIRERPRP